MGPKMRWSQNQQHRIHVFSFEKHLIHVAMLASKPGIVNVARWAGNDVAVKRAIGQCISEEEVEVFEKEAKTMTSLHHPNLVQFYGVGVTDTNEVCGWGNFQKYTKGLKVSLCCVYVLEITSPISHTNRNHSHACVCEVVSRGFHLYGYWEVVCWWRKLLSKWSQTREKCIVFLFCFA